MVQMALFLRFKSQLQRTRPELIPRLEDLAARAVENAGGTITSNRGILQAAFDEKSLGFWLDMLLLIEKLTLAADEAAADLYGYSLLLGSSLADNPQQLCCYLAGGIPGGGAFVDEAAAQALRQYLTLEELRTKYDAGAFFRVKEFKIYIQTATAGFPLRETSVTMFEPGARRAILVVGPSIEGKRDELYRRFAGYSPSETGGGVPPLFVRFGRGGLSALTDSWAEWMRSAAAPPEISGCWETLFRQRLKAEPSTFAVGSCRRFFDLLLDWYTKQAASVNDRPVVILENIHAAEKVAADIAIAALQDRADILLLGTCGTDVVNGQLMDWKPLFPKLLRSSSSITARPQFPDLSLDLLEISYVCSLLCRYFPSDLVPQLLQEAGKSRETISRAISLLHAMRVFDTPLDPQPWHRDFARQAETALGEQADRLKTLVSGLLLAWVKRNKLSPCVRLLEAMTELGCARDIDDGLVLQSLYGELACGDRSALEQAIERGTLETFAGQERALAIRYIIRAMVAIHFGDADDIRAIFAQPPPDCSAFPLLKAQALFCRSLFALGQRDYDSTLEMAKDVTLLCRGNTSPCLSHYYRIFALASLSQKRIGEAVDYFGFAMENAEQGGNAYQAGMAAFYAGAIQLLHGNLARAGTLAEKARRHFLKAASPDWADRSRFLEGRLAFETGHYQQASDIFDDIINNGKGDSSPEKTSLLAAWAYRARASCQPPWPKPQGDSLDADLFELEALYLAEDFAGVAERTSTAPSFPADTDFLYTERPDWRSGFSQCELLYFSQAGLWERMYDTYHALAHSRLYPANGGDDLRAMQKALRGGQFPEIDPFDVFYHYAWYRVAEHTNANRVDVSTAVSVAYKRLQSRAARIDDAETRRHYLTEPRWNKALAQAAAEFKLV